MRYCRSDGEGTGKGFDGDGDDDAPNTHQSVLLRNQRLRDQFIQVIHSEHPCSGMEIRSGRDVLAEHFENAADRSVSVDDNQLRLLGWKERCLLIRTSKDRRCV